MFKNTSKILKIVTYCGAIGVSGVTCDKTIFFKDFFLCYFRKKNSIFLFKVHKFQILVEEKASCITKSVQELLFLF